MIHQPTQKDRERLDLAIIIPELAKYGGAERLTIEGVCRWQNHCDITVYASRFDRDLLQSYGIDDRVQLRELSPYFECEHSMVLNGTLLPKIWEREVDRHDIYLNHLWPTHLVDVHPMIWYPHEPLRALGDLYQSDDLSELSDPNRCQTHIYPKHTYDSAEKTIVEAYFRTLGSYDQLGKPDCIVANSQFTARYLESVYGQEVTEVVYPGVDVDQFNRFNLNRRELKGMESPEIDEGTMRPIGDLPQGLFSICNEKERNVFLTVAQLWPHKQIDRIIEAISLVENVQLYIIGRGPERERLLSQIRSLGVEDRVFILTGLTDREVQIVFAGCRAVVFMPKREPFGIVALETMAAGKPLVGSDEGGFTEVVDENCAMLVAPHPPLIAEKIRELRDNPELSRQMGEAGRQQAEAYSWDRHAEELLDVIYREHKKTCLSRQQRPTTLLSKPLVGIQYYMWYGNGAGNRHWNDNPRFGGVTDMPQAGYYGSSSRETLKRHVDQIETLGCDYIIANLHIDEKGADTHELATFERLLQLLKDEKRQLKVCLQLCPFGPSPAVMTHMIQTIQDRYVEHDNYLTIDDRPVLNLFWTGAWDHDAEILEELKHATKGMMLLASSLRLYDPRDETSKTAGLFNGWSLYSPLELAARENIQGIWQRAYEDADAGTDSLRVLTVSPGYDDRHLTGAERSGNPHRLVPREDGGMYEAMHDFTLSQERQPHLIVISTFNEFHENTHVEPSRNHGDTYSRMTAEFISNVRKQWS